uniref:Hitcher protein n=1 Tax=Manduca sexta TaxID=7130 RepID=Q9U4Y5_MANSE|nr:Hitcher protein [Manduca sexta]
MKVNECTPCTSDLRSYEIDYDDISECTESFMDFSHKKGMTARGNELSPAKMPLMRIRSVEIVYEDEMSTCTDTGILDRSVELLASDSSDDSTKCVDDLEHNMVVEKEGQYDSVTLNAEGDLSEDNSVSLTRDEEIPKIVTPQASFHDVDQSIHIQTECVTLAIDMALSPNVSDLADSGHFTGEASTSHQCTIPMIYEDAQLSNSLDAINVEKSTTVINTFELSEMSTAGTSTSRLYEYIDSNSDSSDTTVTHDADNIVHLTSLNMISPDEDHTLCDSSDLQYDSFVDMGKF